MQPLVRARLVVRRQLSAHCVLAWLKGALGSLFYKGTNPSHQGPTLVTQSPPRASAATSHHLEG